MRFYAEEEKCDESFSKKLAAPFDMYVNDAFGTAHRYVHIYLAYPSLVPSPKSKTGQ